MPFDVDGARKAGYSDQEIAKALLATPQASEALKAGHDEASILGHFGLSPDKIIEQQTGTKKADIGGYGFGRSLLSGLTLGHEPEAEAAFNALTSGGGQDEYMNQLGPIAKSEAAYKARNPERFVAGQTLGSVPPVAAALALGGRGANALLDGAGGPLAEFVAGRSAGPLPLRMASGATQGAVEGTEAALLQSKMNPDGQAGPGVALNTMLGTLSPFVRSAMTPAIARPIAQAAQDASSLHPPVDLNLKQIKQTGSAANRGGNNSQLEAFTHALSRTMGGDHKVLDDSAMTEIRQRIKTGLDDVATRTFIPAQEPGLSADLAGIEARAQSLFRGDDAALRKVQGQIDNVRDALAQGIPGDVYQQMTSHGGGIQRLIDDDATNFMGIKLREAVDGALTRHSPVDDAAKLVQLRNQWRNMQTLRKAISKAPSGTVNPHDVSGAVESAMSEYGFGGGGDLGTLAQIGRLLPRTMATGEAKSPSVTRKQLLLGGAATVAGTYGAIEHSGDAIKWAVQNPEISGAIGALTGLTVGAHSLYKSIIGSKWYRDAMLGNVLRPDRNGVPYPVVGLGTGANQLMPGNGQERGPN